MSYISLHNHTEYSNSHLLDAVIKPKNLIMQAIELGFDGVAVTDHDSLSAAVSMLKIRDEIKESHPNFKIIFGNEIYLIDQSLMKQKPKYYHFILLAKDIEGWKQLKELSSRAWERSYVERGCRRTPTFYQDIEEIVGKNPGHLLAQTACLGGQVASMILEHNVNGANDFVKWCISIFGKDNFALELQPSDSEEQTTVNKVLVKMAKFYGIKFLVTTDSHYLRKQDFGVHSAFINSRSSSDRESDKFYRYTYMMELDEMRELLKKSDLSEEEIEEAINNTALFAGVVEDFDFRHDTIIPAPEVGDFELSHILEQWYDKYECIKYYAYSKYDQDRYLLYLIEQGIKNKKVSIDETKAERINTELDVLRYITDANDQAVSGYLNLVRKIEDIIWQVSIIGISRGSAMSFYINYLIDIVQANPLDYDIHYWRFLNKARSGAGNWPDVDIDVAPSKTDQIIQLLKDYFGERNVINCATFRTESLRSAVLTCGRGMGLNNDDTQALAALVPQKRGISYSLKDCIEGNEERDLEPVPSFIAKLKSFPGLFENVESLEGLISGVGIHASAVYISKKPYTEYVSCMRAPNGTLITSLNMHDSDECGLMKFDLLRTDAEEKIMKCLYMLLAQNQIEWKGSLKQTYFYYLHPDNMIYNDEKMWKDLSECKIPSMFQFEGTVGENCIRKTRPESIKQMGAANAVMRLQASQGQEAPIDRYVRFRNDLSEWYKEMAEYNLNEKEIAVLEKYLKSKFGCASEQEDVMMLLMDPDITNFSLKEADKARKIIAKKKIKDIAKLKEDFYSHVSDGDPQKNEEEEFLKWLEKNF